MNCLQLGLCLLDRHAALHAPDVREETSPLVRAERFAGRRHWEHAPQLGGLARPRTLLDVPVEARRHDADDVEGCAVEHDGLADETRVNPPAAPPEATAE